jgi:hypothetical protein
MKNQPANNPLRWTLPAKSARLPRRVRNVSYRFVNWPSGQPDNWPSDFLYFRSNVVEARADISVIPATQL